MSQNSSQFTNLPSSILPNIFNDIPIPMMCFNDKLQGLYFNAAFSSYIGLDDLSPTERAEITSLNAEDIMPEYQPDGLHSIEVLQKFIDKAIEHGSYQYPWMLKSLSGAPISAQISIHTAQKDEAYYISCYFVDTLISTKQTQKKEIKTESSVLIEHVLTKPIEKNPYESASAIASENSKIAAVTSSFDQDILDSSPLIIHIWSKKLELIDCSLGATNIFGVSSKKEFKKKFFSLCPKMQLGENSQKLMKKHLQQAFSKGFCNFKWMHVDTKGNILPCEVTLCKITYANEECVLGYTQDLSRISRHIQEISKTQESTRAILDAAPIAVNLWDKKFTLRDANLEAARLFGFEDIHSFILNFLTVVPQKQEDGTSSAKIINQSVGKAFEEGYHRVQFTMHHQGDKTPIPLEVTLVRINAWNEELVVAYLRDLRDVKSLIKEIQNSEERIQTIFDLTPLGVNVWDKSYMLIECNKAIVEMYGFEDKESYFSARYKIIPRVQPDGTSTIPLARNMIDTAFEKGYSLVELVTYDINGNPIPVEVVSKRAFVQGQEVVVSYVRDLRDVKVKLAEIKAAEQELRVARDIAEQNAQTKTQFLGTMSHEIRTPLNGVLGLLHVLNETPLQASQKDFVEKGINSANELLGLLDDVLDFSNIDAGTFEIESAPFALDDIVDEIKLIYNPQFAEKKLEFNVFAPSGGPKKLYGDATRVKQVLFNLLNNAKKFTEEGHVTFNVSASEKRGDKIQYIFSIEDSGIGMSKGQSMQIFSAFTQVDSSLTRKHSGAGLGLAIAKRIAKLMDGDVWVKTQKNKGSTFYFTATFTLGPEDIEDTTPKEVVKPVLKTEKTAAKPVQEPKSKPKLAPAPKPAPAPKGSEDAKTAAPVKATKVTKLEQAPKTAPKLKAEIKPEAKVIQQSAQEPEEDLGHIEALSRIDNPEQAIIDKQAQNQMTEGGRILLVEDNEVNQLIVVELLKSRGYVVDVAGNGKIGLQYLQAREYDLILMDIQMPVMDGLTATTRIRSTKKYAEIPIVAMSAHAMQGDIDTCFEHGMNDHLSKPLKPALLYSAIDKWMQKK